MKLLLGGRDHRIEGFTNIDVHNGALVDIQSDISDLSQFKDGSVDEIYASHCLEHFSHVRTVEVLKEWNRVLCSGGLIYISVPDIDVVFNQFKRDGLSDWVRNILWGDQEYKEAFHYTGFNFPTLADKLFQAGFSDVKRITKMPYGLRDCSTLVIGNNHISVNVIGVK